MYYLSKVAISPATPSFFLFASPIYRLTMSVIRAKLKLLVAYSMLT